MQPVDCVLLHRIDHEGRIARIGAVGDVAQGIAQAMHAREDFKVARDRDDEHLFGNLPETRNRG